MAQENTRVLRMINLSKKRARFDAHASIISYGFVAVDKPILTASYEVAYLIGKHGKPHTSGEPLVKPMHCDRLDLTVFSCCYKLTLCLEQTSSLWYHSQLRLLKTE